MRIFRLFAISAVVAGSVVGFGAVPANAGELCEQVWLAGDWTIPQTIGGCQPYNGTLCHWEDAGADPQIHVYTYVCVPDPVETSSGTAPSAS